MNRRAFLKFAGAVPVAAAWGGPLLARLGDAAAVPERATRPGFAPRPGPWRTFEITTRVAVQGAAGTTRLWLPIPAVTSEFQEPLDNRWTGNAAHVDERGGGKKGPRLLYAEFKAGEPAPVLGLTSRVRTRSRAVDWSRPAAAPGGSPPKQWTAPTALLPTDGIVLETARNITRGKESDVDKARAIYDWILATMYREPKVRGCGVGDIKTILETRNFGGKCADINAVFVGLARAAGLPASDVYGIRVAPSAFGYKTLGASSGNITKSQHCRAEVFLREYGWVAVDPADVAKVAREETGQRIPLDHPLVDPVRRALFGAWEGNWIGFNTSHDVVLPRAEREGTLGFLMYPQGETADRRLDCLDPDTFKYSITAREITA